MVMLSMMPIDALGFEIATVVLGSIVELSRVIITRQQFTAPTTEIYDNLIQFRAFFLTRQTARVDVYEVVIATVFLSIPLCRHF